MIFIKKFILLLVIIALIGFIWYHIPVKYERNYEVSTIDGESTHIKANIRYIRKLLDQNRVVGKLEINGKVFVSFPLDSNDSYFTRIIKKFNGEIPYTLFIEDYNGPAAKGEKVIILNENNVLKEIFFQYIDRNQSPKFFYGAAKTSDEANEIAKIFN